MLLSHLPGIDSLSPTASFGHETILGLKNIGRQYSSTEKYTQRERSYQCKEYTHSPVWYRLMVKTEAIIKVSCTGMSEEGA